VYEMADIDKGMLWSLKDRMDALKGWVVNYSLACLMVVALCMFATVLFVGSLRDGIKVLDKRVVRLEAATYRDE